MSVPYHSEWIDTLSGVDEDLFLGANCKDDSIWQVKESWPFRRGIILFRVELRIEFDAGGVRFYPWEHKCRLRDV